MLDKHAHKWWSPFTEKIKNFPSTKKPLDIPRPVTFLPLFISYSQVAKCNSCYVYLLSKTVFADLYECVCVLKSLQVFKSVTDSGQFYAIFFFFFTRRNLCQSLLTLISLLLYSFSVFFFFFPCLPFSYMTKHYVVVPWINLFLLPLLSNVYIHTYLPGTSRVWFYQLSVKSLSSVRVVLSCGPVRGQKCSWRK